MSYILEDASSASTSNATTGCFEDSLVKAYFAKLMHPFFQADVSTSGTKFDFTPFTSPLFLSFLLAAESIDATAGFLPRFRELGTTSSASNGLLLHRRYTSGQNWNLLHRLTKRIACKVRKFTNTVSHSIPKVTGNQKKVKPAQSLLDPIDIELKVCIRTSKIMQNKLQYTTIPCPPEEYTMRWNLRRNFLACLTQCAR